MPYSKRADQTPVSFKRLFSYPVSVFSLHERVPTTELYDQEANQIKNAVQARKEEYATGRYCARRALQELGIAKASPILAASDRAPIWPPGIVGSISHCEELVTAAVARSPAIRGIGIDVEHRQAVSDCLESLICRSDEAHEVALLEDAFPGTGLTIVFCAKEAVYKRIYPQYRTVVDFDAVKINFSMQLKAFHGHVFLPGQERLAIRGQFAVDECLVYCAVID